MYSQITLASASATSFLSFFLCFKSPPGEISGFQFLPERLSSLGKMRVTMQADQIVARSHLLLMRLLKWKPVHTAASF